jgi:hypothetical protein
VKYGVGVAFFAYVVAGGGSLVSRACKDLACGGFVSLGCCHCTLIMGILWEN